MVAIGQEQLRLVEEMLLQIGDFAADAHCTQGSFPADVGVGAGEDSLDIWEEITRHFYGSNVAQGTEGEADDILVGVFEVTGFLGQGRRAGAGL